jgi:hypothetical protein
MSWKDMGGPARRIGDGISRAVDAVGDREDYERAAADLAAMPAGGILGAVIRSLLENQHPDGLDGDDIQAILTRCYRDAAGWLPLERVDAHVLIAVLASALGIHEPGVTYEDVTAPADAAEDEWTSAPVGGATVVAPESAVKPPSTAEYAWHAPLLLADLLRAGGQRLNPYLDAAFAEIVRAETMEMP